MSSFVARTLPTGTAIVQVTMTKIWQEQGIVAQFTQFIQRHIRQFSQRYFDKDYHMLISLVALASNPTVLVLQPFIGIRQ